MLFLDVPNTQLSAYFRADNFVAPDRNLYVLTHRHCLVTDKTANVDILFGNKNPITMVLWVLPSGPYGNYYDSFNVKEM